MSAVGCLGLGLLLVGIGVAFTTAERRNRQGCTACAQGTVVGIEVSCKVNRRGQSELQSRPVVRYRIAERTFRSTAANCTSGKGLAIGEDIAVRYNSHSPNTIVVEGLTGFYLVSVCSFSLGIFLLLVFLQL